MHTIWHVLTFIEVIFRPSIFKYGISNKNMMDLYSFMSFVEQAP